MGLLSALGLVPAARLADVSERLRNSQSRVESLSHKLDEAHRKLDEARAETGAWRAKVEDAQKRRREAEEQAAREAQRLLKFKADAERQAVREAKRTIDVPALESRLDDAERDLVVARDHFMAIEVKLDILEGAATVLDTRTRTLLAQPPAGNGPSR